MPHRLVATSYMSRPLGGVVEQGLRQHLSGRLAFPWSVCGDGLLKLEQSLNGVDVSTQREGFPEGEKWFS